MSTHPLVSVIIPTFNRRNDLLHCLRSLTESSYKNMEIIVVDNGSTDDTSEAVKRHYPNVRLIDLDKNTGVTGGRNAGARVAKGDFILFLDHDMVVDKEMVGTLISFMLNDENIGAIGPVIYYFNEPTKIWAAGTSINILTGKVSFNTRETNEAYFEVQVLPAAIMVRREILQKIGLFDETFFAVYEDTDFCFRIREAGYKVMCVLRAKAWHKTPLDKKLRELHLLSRSYYIARNKIMFMKKHAKLLNFMIFLVIFIPVFAFYYTLISLKYFDINAIKEYYKGLFDGLSCGLSKRLKNQQK
ncbi:MAG: glycosyltransferase family 2 protein [Conexivisphaerales archaeon]